MSWSRLAVSVLTVLCAAFACTNGADLRSRATLVGDQSGDMIRIPAGTFQMGSKETAQHSQNPVHEVRVEAFAIDVTEVTVAAYERCVDAGACRPPFASEFCNWSKEGKGQHPINCVDWDEAVAFCTWARKRLPTDEEWEYAARGTDGRRYPWGNDTPTNQVCWKRKESGAGTCVVGSHPAGAGPYGAHGLQDMAGNVSEWTTLGMSPRSAFTRSLSDRFLRGGDWMSDEPTLLQTSERGWLLRSHRGREIGFRCAR